MLDTTECWLLNAIKIFSISSFLTKLLTFKVGAPGGGYIDSKWGISTANLGAQMISTQFCAPAPLVLLVDKGYIYGIIEIEYYPLSNSIPPTFLKWKLTNLFMKNWKITLFILIICNSHIKKYLQNGSILQTVVIQEDLLLAAWWIDIDLRC